MEGHHPWLLFGVGALALAVLWWVNRTLARRFRRRFNVGLLVAAALVACAHPDYRAPRQQREQRQR